jgi:hypothetical protein
VVNSSQPSRGLCGAEDADVLHQARYDPQDTTDPVATFRASGDERPIDRLVKCRRCGLPLPPRARLSRNTETKKAPQAP